MSTREMQNLIDARKRFSELVDEISDTTPLDDSLRCELRCAIDRLDQKIRAADSEPAKDRG